MTRWCLLAVAVLVGCKDVVAVDHGCVVRGAINASHEANDPNDKQFLLVPPDSNGYRVIGIHHHTLNPIAPVVSIYYGADPAFSTGLAHAIVIDKVAAIPTDALLPIGAVLDVPAHVGLYWWARPTQAFPAGVDLLVCDPT